MITVYFQRKIWKVVHCTLPRGHLWWVKTKRNFHFSRRTRVCCWNLFYNSEWHVPESSCYLSDNMIMLPNILPNTHKAPTVCQELL